MGALSEAEKRVALKVVARSKQVRKWVEAELLFTGIDPGSHEAEAFRVREGQKAAERLIR